MVSGCWEKREFRNWRTRIFNGQAVCEWRLPENFARSYSNTEIAKFSRWYLNDYPVAIWDAENLLLVVGLDPDFFVRYSEVFPLSDIDMIPQYLKVILAVNAAVILFFVFLLGYRFLQGAEAFGNRSGKAVQTGTGASERKRHDQRSCASDQSYFRNPSGTETETE